MNPGPRPRHNLNARHSSVDNLTPVKSKPNVNSRYQGNGTRRARELEQHLRDKYGLPNDSTKNLRRANSHTSLVQYSPEAPPPMFRGPVPPSMTNSKTLHRRKSFDPDFGPKSLAANPSFTHLHQHQVGNNEPRDSKLRYLGRMSPEEQVDKYLKSVEKVNAEKEARLRQRLKSRELSMHLENHTDYRTTFDPSKHITKPRLNSSMNSRWHSLDSVSRPVLAKNVNNIIRKTRAPPREPLEIKSKVTNNNINNNNKKMNAKPNLASRQLQPPYHRERTDLPKSFASMPQIGIHSTPVRPKNRRKSSESSESPVRKTPEEKMSTGSDAKSRESTPYVAVSRLSDHPDDYVDSCSCTDVTLDETLKINHNHRKSLARKKKLQVQRLQELQKAEEETAKRNDNHLNKNINGKSIRANYLGSINLDSKSSDLLSLQKPLKSLYFKYVIAQQAGLDTTSGSLEITKTGLKV